MISGVIESLPVQIVHIVEHPEEVPRPQRIAAHDKKARGIERDIGAAVLRIGEVDAPHRAFMIARFKVRLREHADFADRRLVHQRADVAGHLLIDMNQLATRCIDEANRSEEHKSELQSLMRNSYDVFCLKKKKPKTKTKQFKTQQTT